MAFSFRYKNTLLVLAFLVADFEFSSAQNSFPPSGDVGIGTTTPQGKLTVIGNIQTTSFNSSAITLQQRYVDFGVNNLIGGASFFKTDNAQNSSWSLGAIAGTVGTKSQTTGYPGGLAFFTKPGDGLTGSAPIERMRIDHNGNIGIGTLIPTEKLSVNGNIRSHEIKVEIQNWPDYVFLKEYKLPSLRDIEKHIKEQEYLPGIPSAKEVEGAGIELGKLNAKLLEKIEELTLHLIEMKKENEHLNERITRFEVNGGF